jgi:UDP-glucose 6-dehydrogenase
MISREREADFFAGLIEKEARASGKPVILLGIAFKPGTAIMVGSHAALLSTILKERGIEHTIHDPNIEAYATTPLTSAVYFIGCKHKDFSNYSLPNDSIVLDPHRSYSSIVSKGKYIPIGIGEHVA